MNRREIIDIEEGTGLDEKRTSIQYGSERCDLSLFGKHTPSLGYMRVHNFCYILKHENIPMWSHPRVPKCKEDE